MMLFDTGFQMILDIVMITIVFGKIIFAWQEK